MIQLVYRLFRALLSNLVARAIKQTRKKNQTDKKSERQKEETDELKCAGQQEPGKIRRAGE